MRSVNSGRNATIGVTCKIFILILNFVVRTVFAYTLSAEYLGISSLFTNVILILNLSDLGLNQIIIYALYKPLSEGNHEKIKELMRFYRNTYRLMGFIFLALGISCMPFLPYLLTGSTNLVNVYLVFILYLAQTVSSYWFFAYKKVLLTADQKEYINTIVTAATTLLLAAVQVVVLVSMTSQKEIAFYLYVAAGVITTLINNAVSARIVSKKYPYILEKKIGKLKKEEKTSLLKNLYGGALYKVSGTVNNAMGSLIISSLIGVVFVGFYSNYTLILSGVSAILGAMFGPVTASVGNLIATESVDRCESVFRALHLAYFWAFGFCGLCFFVLINPFIDSIWLGSEWLLGNDTVVALTAKFLIDGLMGAVICYRQASGLYWETRYRYVASVIVNFLSSLIFVRLGFGVTGVVMGCCCAELVALFVDPFIVYKRVFKKSPSSYYLLYFKTFGLVVLTIGIVYGLRILFGFSGISGFIVECILCLIIPNGCWYLLFRNSEEFKKLMGVAKATMDAFRNRKKGQE